MGGNPTSAFRVKTKMFIEGWTQDTWADFDVTLLKLFKLQLQIFLKSTGVLKILKSE